MDIFVGIAIVLIVFFSTSSIEKRLKKVEEQNNKILSILEADKNHKNE